jgi:radical SAM superfamily enzyme YgiQ (UPF0313 family)
VRICLATAHCKPAFIPLALLYLKACLVEQKGLNDEDVLILEFGPDAPADQIADAILAADADLIALSCYVWNIRALTRAANRIKARRPSATIVLGGPEVGPVAASTLQQHLAVDVIVKSEGEVPFCAIVERRLSGADLEDVSGICFRRGGEIVDTGDAPILSDLNTLASPHTERFATNEKRVVCVETQRGCVFRCNFCFYNKDLSIRNRRFDLERVKREILFWLERDAVELYLMDPVFNLNAERAKEICRFIAAHNHRRIPVHTEVWAEFIDDELAALMRDAHFRFVEVGLQTTDDNVLATVERRLRLKKFLDGVASLKKYDLPFELQLIYGLPGETRETFRKSLNFAAALDPSALSVFPLMVLPGTELWRKAEGFHLAYDTEPPYYVRSHFSMDADDIRYGWKVNEALDWLESFHTIRFLRRERNINYADVVDEWIAARPASLAAFVERVCAKNDIPPDFYRASVSIETATPVIERERSRQSSAPPAH